VCEAAGRGDVVAEERERRAGDPAFLCADVNLINTAIGFSSKYALEASAGSIQLFKFDTKNPRKSRIKVANVKVNVSCPICKTPTRKIAHGVIAPWLIELSKIDEKLTSLHICTECELKFFSYRYSNEEANRLYENYRKSPYTKSRKKWEPWYGQNENDIYNPEFTLENILKRKNTFERESRLSKMELPVDSNVLDYGGDLGQFFPERFSGKKYLFDLSELETKEEDGLIRIQDVTNIVKQIDLVMLCGVLEHLTDIDKTLSEVKSTLKNGGYLYLEVPLDGFSVSKFHGTDMYRRYLKVLSKFRYLFIAMDLYTGLYRNFFRRIPMFGIVKQSEHINYFSKKSLSCARRTNFEPTYISEPDSKLKHGKFRMGFLAGVALIK
jgi:SAM-dependent methyltransferase